MSIMNVQSGQVDSPPLVRFKYEPGAFEKLYEPGDTINLSNGEQVEYVRPQCLTCCPCCGQWFNVRPDGWPEVKR